MTRAMIGSLIGLRTRRRLRGAVDRAARASGLLALFERRMRGGLTVLTYHRVLAGGATREAPFPSLAMPASTFRTHVEWLADACRVLPVGEALERLRRGERDEKPLVALTFDDGYADNAEVAAPILAAAGLRATFFVTTGFVAGTPLWFDRAARLHARVGQPGVERSTRAVFDAGVDASAASDPEVTAFERDPWIEMLKRQSVQEREQVLARLEQSTGAFEPDDRFQALGIEDLRDLARAGHEIGSHSASHPILPLLDDAELERELGGSRETLCEWLGSDVGGFCHPNGDCDERVVRAVERAGYRYACSTRPGLNQVPVEHFRIARIDVTPMRVQDAAGDPDLTAFRCEIAGFHEALR